MSLKGKQGETAAEADNDGGREREIRDRDGADDTLVQGRRHTHTHTLSLSLSLSLSHTHEYGVNGAALFRKSAD